MHPPGPFHFKGMEELIPLQDHGGQKIVSARALHEFLESKQEFANWIKNRIEKYGFEENRDFLIILSKSDFGRPSKEYALTLDTAKEIAMVEGNEKGKIARQYFIECEKRLNSPDLIVMQAMNILQGRVESLLKENRGLTAKATYADLVLTRNEKTYRATELAKELHFKSAIELHRELSRAGVVYKFRKQWVLKAKYSERPYMKRVPTQYTDPETGTDKERFDFEWTETGRAFLHWMLNGDYKERLADLLSEYDKRLATTIDNKAA